MVALVLLTWAFSTPARADETTAPRSFVPSGDIRPVWAPQRTTSVASVPNSTLSSGLSQIQTGNSQPLSGVSKRPLKWRTRIPISFNSAQTSHSVLINQPKVRQAQGIISDTVDAESAPRLFAPIRSTNPTPFEDPFGDQSKTYVEVIESPVITNGQQLAPIRDAKDWNVADLQDAGGQDDDCLTENDDVRGPDRECKIARCRLQKKSIFSVSLNIDPRLDPDYDNSVDTIPHECGLGFNLFAQRCWTPMTFTWKASALCHKPLYFEDVKLERYGHSSGPFSQPICSAAHFFANIALLPYNMGINPPSECRYALGYYRPGSCAPWLINPIPISPRGALLQTGAVLGAVYAIP